MRNRQRGQALIEFALILPVAVFLMLGAADLLMLISASADLNYVAQQTAVWCSETNTLQGQGPVMPNCSDQDTGRYDNGNGMAHASVLAFAVNLTPVASQAAGFNATVTCPAGCTGSLGGEAQVTATYNWNLLFPLPGIPNPVPLTATATAP